MRKFSDINFDGLNDSFFKSETDSNLGDEPEDICGYLCEYLQIDYNKYKDLIINIMINSDAGTHHYEYVAAIFSSLAEENDKFSNSSVRKFSDIDYYDLKNSLWSEDLEFGPNIKEFCLYMGVEYEAYNNLLTKLYHEDDDEIEYIFVSAIYNKINDEFEN